MSSMNLAWESHSRFQQWREGKSGIFSTQSHLDLARRRKLRISRGFVWQSSGNLMSENLRSWMPSSESSGRLWPISRARHEIPSIPSSSTIKKSISWSTLPDSRRRGTCPRVSNSTVPCERSRVLIVVMLPWFSSMRNVGLTCRISTSSSQRCSVTERRWSQWTNGTWLRKRRIPQKSMKSFSAKDLDCTTTFPLFSFLH